MARPCIGAERCVAQHRQVGQAGGVQCVCPPGARARGQKPQRRVSGPGACVGSRSCGHLLASSAWLQLALGHQACQPLGQRHTLQLQLQLPHPAAYRQAQRLYAGSMLRRTLGKRGPGHVVPHAASGREPGQAEVLETPEPVPSLLETLKTDLVSSLAWGPSAYAVRSWAFGLACLLAAAACLATFNVLAAQIASTAIAAGFKVGSERPSRSNLPCGMHGTCMPASGSVEGCMVGYCARSPHRPRHGCRATLLPLACWTCAAGTRRMRWRARFKHGLSTAGCSIYWWRRSMSACIALPTVASLLLPATGEQYGSSHPSPSQSRGGQTRGALMGAENNHHAPALQAVRDHCVALACAAVGAAERGAAFHPGRWACRMQPHAA